MPRAVYAIIAIIILALAGSLPAYLAIGQGGSETSTVTIAAQPAYSPPGGFGGGGVPGGVPKCPADEVATGNRVSSVTGLVFQDFVIKSFDKRFSLFLDEGIVVLTPDGKCPRCIGIHEMTPPPSLPEGAYLIGTAYDTVPDLTSFNPPATIIYSYDLADIPEGFTEQDLVIATRDPATGEWMKLDCVVDTEANAINAQIGLFNDLVVLCYEPAAPASFQPSSLSISPTEVEIGESVNITVLVANTGGQSGEYEVVLKINGTAEAVSKVVLDTGTSEQVSFTTSKDTAGIYSVEVNGLTGTFEVRQPPVTPVTPPEPTPAKPINWWLIGGIIAAVVVLAIAIYLLRRRMAY